MKKIIIVVLILSLFMFVSVSHAATCTAQGAGNWWTAATWSCGGETRVPAAGDDVALAGYVITWDVASGARIPATSGSLGTVTSTGTAGQITVDISDSACHTAGTCQINATSITAGTKPTTPGIVLVTGTTDHTLAINANVTAGSNSTAIGVYHNGTGTVTITGDVKGSNQISGTGAINVTTGILNVTGNVTGGSSANANGYGNSSTGTGTITGNVTGGSNSQADGVSSVGAGAVTLVGNLIDSTAVAWRGKSPTWSPGNTYYRQLSDGTKLYVSTDPGIANVKTGTSYYIQGSSLTGTMTSGGGSWGF